MPWQIVSTVSSRAEFVALARVEGANVRSLCRRFGISPKTGYKWMRRAAAGGDDPLADRSRRPTHSPGRTASAVEDAIVALRGEHPCWGGRKLRQRLLNLGRADVPSASTIAAVLRRHGCLGSDPPTPRAFVRFEAAAPNQLWQMDFKGHFAMANARCHPLTIVDDHSRFATAIRACGNERNETVREALTAVFRVYGLPDRLLCDNGAPWGSAGSEEKHTGLSVWLSRLGVRVVHGRPYHPQTQGKDERFHRTLKAEVLQGRSFRDLTECQDQFDRWREVYNTIRPHDSLSLAVPASRYRVSGHAYPETLPEVQYLDGDVVRKVQKGGEIGFAGRWWKVGKPFVGERVALRPSEVDGVWSVYFARTCVATIDRNPRE